MGEWYVCKCKNCGYEAGVDVGLDYLPPLAYENITNDMKSGRLGVRSKHFFAEHTDGAIAFEKVVCRCTKCGSLKSTRDLTMYLPKKNKNTQKQEDIANRGYFYKEDLLDNFDEYQKYNHRCSDCRGKMEIIPDFETEMDNGTFKCPKCGGLMEKEDVCMVD